MSKNSHFTGQPIFSQLLFLLPQDEINRTAREFNSDAYCKKFRTYNHLITMLYCIFNRCTSLREVTSGLLASEQKILHLGVDYQPRRSTLADANARRDSAVFEAIYMKLLSKIRSFSPDSRSGKASQLYIVDSTTIKLFSSVLTNAGRKPANGKRKGGIKVHTLISSAEDVPSLIQFTAASANDGPFLKEIQLPSGSIIVFDKGYLSYNEWNRFNDQDVTWITRLNKSAVYEVREQKTLTEEQIEQGIKKDWIITLGHNHYKGKPKVEGRLVEYYDSAKDELFQFITNSTLHDPFTICEFYRKRWQIELLFKRFKQNYPLHHFLGDSSNAIKIQIWCALICDLILKYIKSKVKKKWAFSNLASFIRIHLMTYIELFSFLKNPEKSLMKPYKEYNLPSLFAT